MQTIIGILLIVGGFLLIAIKLITLSRLFSMLFTSLRAEIRPETAKPIRPLAENERKELLHYLVSEKKGNRLKWGVFAIVLTLPVLAIIFISVVPYTPIFSLPEVQQVLIDWTIVIAVPIIIFYLISRIDSDKMRDLKNPVYSVTSVASKGHLVETPNAFKVGRYAFQLHAMSESCKKDLEKITFGKKVYVEFSPLTCYLWRIETN